MSKEDYVLDALAWANVKEPARIAKVASGLVRGTNQYNTTITKTAIADAVKATHPPHGRGKAVIEGVTKAIEEQRPIWTKRRDERTSWESYLSHKAQHATRLNDAYAARFNRPSYLPDRPYPGGYGDWQASQAWQAEERKRDHGDRCIGLMIFREVHTVCLLSECDFLPGQHYIAVRDRLGGEPAYTALRESCRNFVEAAIVLGGPKVRSALSRGYPVLTDWVARRSTITYPNGKSETLPWLTVAYKPVTDNYGTRHNAEHIVVLGTEVVGSEGHANVTMPDGLVIVAVP